MPEIATMNSAAIPAFDDLLFDDVSALDDLSWMEMFPAGNVTVDMPAYAESIAADEGSYDPLWNWQDNVGSSLEFSTNCFDDAELADDASVNEYYTYPSYVADQHDFNSHFYRNISVVDLTDSMVARLEALYKKKIEPVTSIADLKVVLEKICLKKGPLAQALSSLSGLPAAQLKDEMKDSQTSQTRCLLLALVVNRAMQILAATRPEVLDQYSNQIKCGEEFGKLWKPYSDFSEHELITKCMASFKVIQNELHLDCSHGKKGLVITAALMIADPERTYSNGGSQARWVKVLEEMFHEITGCTVKSRGTKRSAEEMSDDAESSSRF